MNRLHFEIVDLNNIKNAIKIQKEIFPHEDGTINLLSSLDRNLFMKISGIFYPDDKVKYYLAYFKNNLIGITGLYLYPKYPDDAWIGWYGISLKFRNRGFGTEILEWTIEKAKTLNYKTIRLYTDNDDNANAVKLYKKMDFIGEKYNAENLCYNCWIYSKSLTDKTLELWNNKQLDLLYQSDLDQMSSDKIKEIKNKYESILKRENKNGKTSKVYE